MPACDLTRLSTRKLAVTVAPLGTVASFRTGASEAICASSAFSAAAVVGFARHPASMKVGEKMWQKYSIPLAP